MVFRAFRRLAILMAVVASCLPLAGVAAADTSPVVVFNNGNNPGGCSVGGYGGQYAGFATVIISGAGVGMINSHAALVSGTSVSETTVVRQNSCVSVFATSGVRCHVPTASSLIRTVRGRL